MRGNYYFEGKFYMELQETKDYNVILLIILQLKCIYVIYRKPLKLFRTELLFGKIY